MTTRVISMRLRHEQVDRLQRLARRFGRTPSETSALLVEEALRRAEFALIDFRDSPVGRQAYLQGSTLAVWEVVALARDHDLDAAATARYLDWPEHRVQAALNYATAYPVEIEAAIADNDAVGWVQISRLLPTAGEFVVPRNPHGSRD
jgi:hypothetical protein